MIRCGFCGRENDEQSKFCIDCGSIKVFPVPPPAKPSSMHAERQPGFESAHAAKAVPETRVSSPAAPKGGAVKPCASCGKARDTALPFCPHCGAHVDRVPGRPSGTTSFSAHGTRTGLKLTLLDQAGEAKKSFALDRGEATFGRSEGDIKFPEDIFLSPMHAHVATRDGVLLVRDLGSRNGTWVFIDGPYRLQDGDTILIGSQLLRFRRLGYPGPHPPEADQTRRLGSLTPSADIAVLAQLRADGSARDAIHLSPGRHVKIGRDVGDWLFPYDQTMSSKHAEVRSEDLEFIVLDDGSRNGIAVAVRGERPVKAGQRFLIGDQTLRVESV